MRVLRLKSSATDGHNVNKGDDRRDNPLSPSPVREVMEDKDAGDPPDD
jgi:hypothetical protein